MVSLYQDPGFTFRFAEDRIIQRFHLEGAEPAQMVAVYKIDPATGEHRGLITTAIVGNGGWVDLAEPIIVRAGDAFTVVPVAESLNMSSDRMILYGVAAAVLLAVVGYVAALILGQDRPFLLAACSAAVGGFVVLLGYGPVAYVIRALAALANSLHGRRP